MDPGGLIQLTGAPVTRLGPVCLSDPVFLLDCLPPAVSPGLCGQNQYGLEFPGELLKLVSGA